MNLREKLKREICESDWDSLEKHANIENLFLIDQSLSLIDIGVSIASDNVKEIQVLLEMQKIKRPTERFIDNWKKTPGKIIGQILIVSPFILLQLK